MIKTISITSKWQLHIPKEMRTAFGDTKNPTQVDIKLEGGKLILTPHKDKIGEMAGAFQKQARKHRDIDIENIRDHIDYAEL